MIAPSISFDTNTIPNLWAGLSVDDVKELIRQDVADINYYLPLQVNDEMQARASNRQPDWRLRSYVKSLERAQDAHWSWYRELLDVDTAGANGPEGVGEESVGAGNQ